MAMEFEVMEVELQSILLSMKKGKILGLEDFMVEFYIGFFELQFTYSFNIFLDIAISPLIF